MLTTLDFKDRVAKNLRREGLSVRKVYRVYPPLDAGGCQEVLFVSHDGRPGTCMVNCQGELEVGPWAGFGA